MPEGQITSMKQSAHWRSVVVTVTGGWQRGSSDLSALDGIGGVWSVIHVKTRRTFLRNNKFNSLTVVRTAEATKVITGNLWLNHGNKVKKKGNDN